MYASGDDILIQDPVEWGHPLNQGLVSWWMSLPALPRGLRWHDLTRRNHGTLTNGPTWQGARERPGGWGSLGLTAASSQYVVAPYLPAALAGSTAAAWIRPVLPQAGMALMNGADNGYPPFTGWSLGVGAGGETNSQLTGLANGVMWAGSGYYLPTSNVWYHVVAVIDAGYGWTFYVNGRLVGTSYGGAFKNNSGSPSLRIGSQTGFRYFSGGVDDVRVYSRIFDAADVAALYAESKQGYPALLKRVRRAAVKAPAAPPAGGAPLGTLALLGCGR